ncbi:MAG TPA: MFS transporter [Saprospiraceae bacterium]|nr:MFS transporter [Saprospiraceae bacterium]MCB9329395.1 MFS transporter [Lewinellaceae bacterium]HPK08816.1 MFS transporter [Saprospiraceae bacterium]HRX28816.1 MFS transporter [Saprospiraceae bacterium]
MSHVNKNRLFIASCMALLVTSMTFAIRAGILNQLGGDFLLSNKNLGWINSMAFFGFPVATILGGLFYNSIGPKRLILIAFFFHLLGLILTIFASGFWTLLISTFFIGFANGSVEAACNPMIAELYPNDKTTMLNRFHVWFPGGIVIGSLISMFMSNQGMAWQWQIAIMLVPTLIYGYLFLGQEFPKTKALLGSTSKNFQALFNPLFIFMMVCMTLTAVTELGTQQWVEKILKNSGASPMVVLALMSGLMALGRLFAGPVVHRLNSVGVLLLSSVIATIGIYTMSFASGDLVYISAILFAIGVMYFWPTMLGFVSEYLPQTGALGISLMGGAGMLAVAMWQPVIGGWLDTQKSIALSDGFDESSADLIAGQATLSHIAIFPAILVLLFGILWLYRNKIVKA